MDPLGLIVAVEAITTFKEIAGLAGAGLALLGSLFQGRQSLHKSRTELRHAEPPVHVKEPRSWVLDLFMWPLSLRTMWNASHDGRSDPSAARRDAQHFVAVSLIWFIILSGALLAVAAAILELVDKS
jgi:hypothetical protein